MADVELEPEPEPEPEPELPLLPDPLLPEPLEPLEPPPLLPELPLPAVLPLAALLLEEPPPPHAARLATTAAVNSALTIVFQLNRHSMMIAPYWVVLIVCPLACLYLYAGHTLPLAL